MLNDITQLESALHEWRQTLGTDRVRTDAVSLQRYSECTTPVNIKIPAALTPECVDHVVSILKIANRHRTPLYPISTGNNWGYGSANPVRDGCVIVDLSRMNNIHTVDTELGLVTVEPGVTQGQLQQYLKDKNLPFFVPTTGAGPNCSLIGNTLERGYGITPQSDHFTAAMWLETVLPNGDVYRGALTELGGAIVDQTYKWGLGPYIDGIFTQGNYGVVTKMTIALARRQAYMQGFFFGVPDDRLESAVQSIRDILGSLNGITSSINLMNTRRILAMLEPYPPEQLNKKIAIPEDAIQKIARRHRLTDWTGIGAIYGDKTIVRAASAVIRSRLRPPAHRLWFIRPKLVHTLKKLQRYTPWTLGDDAQSFINRLSDSMQILDGTPSEVALRLAYWKFGSIPEPGQALNPARDGCGLMWYAPLVPMKGAAVRRYVDMVKSVCQAYEMDPLITMTSLSDRCFDSTVPLLYDKNDPTDVERARECFYALFNAGREQGVLPYRLGIHSMHLLTHESTVFSQLSSQIKNALDPNHIIAPGRYSRE
jgi:4-cresol dehydrogenase (hydroxylating)